MGMRSKFYSALAVLVVIGFIMSVWMGSDISRSIGGTNVGGDISASTLAKPTNELVIRMSDRVAQFNQVHFWCLLIGLFMTNVVIVLSTITIVFELRQASKQETPPVAN